MRLLVIAVDAEKLRREDVVLRLNGAARTPIAAVEIIPVPKDDGETILEAASRAVEGLEEALTRRGVPVAGGDDLPEPRG